MSDTGPVIVILAVLALLGFGIYWIDRESAEEREAFMAECTQHRPKYECVAMWRAGNAKAVAVPVVVTR